ncbi:4-hydroxy-3-methylbut-2-enyl diphosphate reductase [Lachnospiraceae bacterium LCP25S3_G4]
MEVILAKTAGFCFGVKKAVEIVYEQVAHTKNQNIYTYGPIIHNDEVIKDMRSKGVRVIETEEDLRKLKEGIVIIRSHGVPKRIYDILHGNGIEYVDATCPYVKKIHQIVKRESEAGNHIVITGNPEHPEVEGIKGWSVTPVTIVQSVEDVLEFTEHFDALKRKSICVVSQTTFNYNKFKDLVEIITKKSYDVSVLNTICSATKERQTEAEAVAKDVDAMIVIGDKHSSNTQKLFEICKRACNNTYYIQTLGDLNLNQLESVERVGITAGASTPNNIIEEVQNNVRVNF